MNAVTSEPKNAMHNQTTHTPTVIAVPLNQRLGEPLRRDAMNKPARAAGISAEAKA